MDDSQSSSADVLDQFAKDSMFRRGDFEGNQQPNGVFKKHQ